MTLSAGLSAVKPSSMPLFDLVRREMATSPRTLVLMAALAGISNALIMALINNSAGLVDEALNLRTVLMFALCVGIFTVSQKTLMKITTTEVETILHRLRLRMVEKIARADLVGMEAVGRSDILASMIRDTQTISQAASMLMISCQSVILVVLAMGYVLITSRTAFMLSAVFIVVALSVVVRRLAEFRHELHMSMEKENQVFDDLRDVLDGFKEVKMSTTRRDALLAHLGTISRVACQVKVAVQTRSATEYVLGQVLIFLLLGLIVFVVPMFSPQESGAVTKTTTAILFIIGPLGAAIQTVPMIAGANAAAESIMRLSALFERIAAPEPAGERKALPQPFEEIQLDGVSFTYHDPKAAANFAVGPINLTIRRGETLFITGGNGSGKSTLMKLLVGLYFPERGVLRVDGMPLTDETYAAYREQFSAVFADYHLFKRLYGVDEPSADRVEELFQLMEMTGKARLADGAFDTMELSSGQRKRLALLVSMIEDKPIVVLDEWAADQDPVFRRKFYTELLAYLKKAGKTVIAITHDDRYFSCADRCIFMEEGRLVAAPDTRTGHPAENQGDA